MRILWKIRLQIAFVFGTFCSASAVADWRDLDLPREHVPLVFNNHPDLKRDCEKDPACPFKDLLQDKSCWGFEPDCVDIHLPNFTKGCSLEQSQKYWNQGDFGNLKSRLDEMKSRQLCEPFDANGSSLVCTSESTMCRAKNMYLHIRRFDERQDNQIVVAKDDTIGGYCKLKRKQLDEETAFKRSLSTWGIQLQSFKSLDFDPFVGAREKCDVVMTKPVVFVQLDAVGSLYHHFCDFFNLYQTQLANNSWFGTDVQIVRWNDHPRFRDPFSDAWKVFTKNEVWSLYDLAHKRVCIPEATFAFLPRMSRGLYYSTYLEPSCRGSRMIKAFSDHLLHRLNVARDPSHGNDVIHVTFLQRGGKKNPNVFRRVLNIDSLVKRLRKIPHFEVKTVSYDFQEMSFLDQLRITRNTDIFIGMHGAGLTHFLFLPDWAVAFELYNCGDIRCYRDLAALRGLRYITWEDESKITTHDKNEHKKHGAQAKFWNYSFDVEEFIRLMRKARDYLLETDRFRHLRTKIDHSRKRKSEL